MAKQPADPDAKLRKFVRDLAVKEPLKLTPANRPVFVTAQDRGLVEECPDPKPPKKPAKNPPTFVRLTPDGRRWLIQGELPTAALDAIRDQCQRHTTAVAQPDDLDHLTSAVRAVEEQLSTVRRELSAAAEKRAKQLTDLRETLALFEGVAGRVTTDVMAKLAGSVDRSTPTQTPTNRPTDTELTAVIVEFVRTYAAEHFGNGCKLDELKAALDARGFALTIGQFQDLLRTLHRNQTITLRGWGQPLDLLPPGELAFFIATTVMYYVYPHNGSSG